MEKFVWLFPVLFIFHDMEEIIGLGIWYKNNKDMLDKKFHKVSKIYENYSTEGMALAVFEEFILCIIICIIAIFKGTYALWLGVFIAYTIHLIIHIGQSIVIRKYIPALMTSVIAIPISICIIRECILLLGYEVSTVVLVSVIGIVVVALNLKFAHILMHKFTKWMRMV